MHMAVDKDTRLGEIADFVKRMTTALRGIRSRGGVEALHDVHLFLTKSEMGGTPRHEPNTSAEMFLRDLTVSLDRFNESVEERLFIISDLAGKVNEMIRRIRLEELRRKQ
jgi:hypothetical protein